MGPELNQPLNPASRPSPAPRQAAPAKPTAPAKPEINQVTGFFDGFVKEGVQAATGVYTMLTTNPFKTASGLFYMATHPGQAVSAIVNPYVVAHQQGRYGEIGGRATFQVLSMVLGSGVASKKGTGAKAAEPTAVMIKQADDVTNAMANRLAANRATRLLKDSEDKLEKSAYAELHKTKVNEVLPDIQALLRDGPSRQPIDLSGLKSDLQTAVKNNPDKNYSANEISDFLKQNDRFFPKTQLGKKFENYALKVIKGEDVPNEINASLAEMMEVAKTEIWMPPVVARTLDKIRGSEIPARARVVSQLTNSGFGDEAIEAIAAAATSRRVSIEQAHNLMVIGAKQGLSKEALIGIIADNTARKNLPFMMTGIRNGVPVDDLLAMLKEQGATVKGRVTTETTQKLLMSVKDAKLIASVSNVRSADAIAARLRHYEELLQNNIDAPLGPAIEKQVNKIVDALKTEPRTFQLVDKLFNGHPVGSFERIGTGIGAGIDDVGTAIGGGFHRVGDAGKKFFNHLDQPVTWGDYARGVRDFLPNVGRAIDNTARGVGDFLRQGLGAIELPTIKLPEINWSQIASSRAPNLADVGRAPFRAVGAMWNNPGKTIGYGTVIGNTVNLGQMGLRAASGEDITGAGAYYRTNLTRVIDAQLDALTQQTAELDAMRMELEPMPAADILKGRKELEKNLGLDLGKAPKDGEGLKAYILKQFGDGFKNIAKARENIRAFSSKLETLSDAELLAARPKLEDMGLSVEARPGEADAYKAAVLAALGAAAGKSSGKEQESLRKLHDDLQGMSAEQVLGIKPQLDEKGLKIPLETPGAKEGVPSPQDAEAFKALILKQLDAALEQVKGPEKEEIAKLRAQIAAAPAAKVLAGRAALAEMKLGVEEPAKEQLPASGAKPATDEGTKPASGEEAEAYKRALLQEIDQRMAKTNGHDKQKLAQLKATLANAPAAEMLANRDAFDKMNLDVGAALKPSAPGQSPVTAPGTMQAPAQYTVRPGDTLSDIAVNQMGGYTSWPQIQRANQGRYPTLANNPDYIRSGWQLQLPGRPAAAQGQATGTPAPVQAPGAPAPATQTGGPANAQAAAQRAQVTAKFRLEPSDANWANFQAEVASYATQAIGPDAGSKEDVQALQQLLGKLGFNDVQATGEFVEKDAQGQVRLDAQGQPMSPTGTAVMKFKIKAGLTQSYNVMGPDGRPTPDVNPYVDTTTLNAMGISLRLLQDTSLRSEKSLDSAVKEAARLAKEAVGAETGSLADRQTVQNALVANGYQVPTSGTFDDATIAAIIDFKRKNNLAAGFTNDRGEAVFTPYIDRREAEVLLNRRPATR